MVLCVLCHAKYMYVADSLLPLDDVIYCTLLVTLLGFSPPNDTNHDLFVYLLIEGDGNFQSSVQYVQAYSTSLDITGPLSCCIGSKQSLDYL